MSKILSESIEIIMCSTHFLFDYDGTIVDSNGMHRKAFDSLFHDLGLDYNFENIFGLDTRTAIRQVLSENKKKVGLQEFENFVSQKRRYVWQVFDQLSLQPGVRMFLERFRGARPFAICSSASEKTIYQGLAQLGLTDYFEMVYGAEAVLHCKPFPDVYLEAVNCFGCSSSDCVVFEDTEIGVQAAKSAGCQVIDVRLTSFEDMIMEIDSRDYFS